MIRLCLSDLMPCRGDCLYYKLRYGDVTTYYDGVVRIQQYNSSMVGQYGTWTHAWSFFSLFLIFIHIYVLWMILDMLL